ncbi:hypothetical protein QK292_13155 [Arthrobacter sp. AL08]|uniref:hypothetical protein n=1 Tax=unclassified Arthrobacter TaxID=235627 RepID=UPI00249C4231|nr:MULTISPECIES: hypothetical protein [unclassified Arthrobacter]MDI3242494.1 hypothetical protein [Arthrobacter sp. AL05]MDI3278510.1 hypothetical protein [Arthrobacter sp. AL08]
MDMVTLYGSSMGGFGALMIAASLPGARAVAEVPQLDLLQYPDPEALADVERLALAGTSLRNIEDKHPERVNVLARFRHSGRIPPFTLITNRADSAHSEALDFLASVNSIAPTMSSVGPTSVHQTPRPEGHAVQPSPVMIQTLKAMSQLPCEVVDVRLPSTDEPQTNAVPHWDLREAAGWKKRSLTQTVTWIESPGNGKLDLEFEIRNDGAESAKGIVLCLVPAHPDTAAMNQAGFQFSSYRGIGYFKYVRIPSGTSLVRQSVSLFGDCEIMGFGLAAWDLESPKVTNLKSSYRSPTAYSATLGE